MAKGKHKGNKKTRTAAEKDRAKRHLRLNMIKRYTKALLIHGGKTKEQIEKLLKEWKNK